MYRHYRVVRMGDKAGRILRDLFQSYVGEPLQLPPRYQERIAQRRPAPRGVRLHRGHDRPLRPRRAPQALRSPGQGLSARRDRDARPAGRLRGGAGGGRRLGLAPRAQPAATSSWPAAGCSAGLVFVTLLAANIGAGLDGGRHRPRLPARPVRLVVVRVAPRWAASCWASSWPRGCTHWRREARLLHRRRLPGGALRPLRARAGRGGALWLGTLSILAGQLIAMAWAFEVMLAVPKPLGLLPWRAWWWWPTSARGGLLASAWVNLSSWWCCWSASRWRCPSPGRRPAVGRACARHPARPTPRATEA